MNRRPSPIVISLVWVREDPPADGDQDDVERDADDTESIAFPLGGSPRKLLGLLGVLAMFALLGVGMIYQGMQGEDPSPRWSAERTLAGGIFVVTVFGLCVIKCIVALLRSKGIYVVRDGVNCFGTLGAAWLPLSAIEQVDVEVRVVDWSARARNMPRPVKFRTVQRRLAFTIRSDRDVTVTGLERLVRRERLAGSTYHFFVGDADAHQIREAILRRLTTST